MVELSTNRTERLAPGTVLQGPSGPLQVSAAAPSGRSGGRDRWIVTFAGVDGRDGAEGLRDAVLRAEAVHDPDALWVHELVGSEVVDLSGVSLGRVEAVEANPASDLLVLADGHLIPLRFVTLHRPGRVTVDVPPGLFDL